MMPGRLESLIKDVDASKARLDAARPLPRSTVASLREKLNLDWTYNSNAIEGNTLTLHETKVVLEGITVGGKTLREHFEVVNHRDAILYVEELVAADASLSEFVIRNIHALILMGIEDEDAGRYRIRNVVISGATTTPPDSVQLPEKMSSLIEWHNAALHTDHTVIRAAELHTRFVKIHPFIDGNGRTGRLLLNLELMKAGYPPAVITTEERTTYYDVLDLACSTGDFSGIATLVAQAAQRSLAIYLDVLGIAQRRDGTV